MMDRSTTRAIALPLFLAFLALASCAPRGVIPGSSPMIADRLYFGDSIPGGGKVTDAGWSDFLRDVVTPRFPNGLTTWRASGQWRDEGGMIIREGTFVLELIHDADMIFDTHIDEIIEHYKRIYRQESVLWVRSPVSVRF